MEISNISTITTIGYQYDGLTEEDRLVNRVLKEHYNKIYQENLSHADPMAYIRSKYCDVTSPNFCSYMTEDQRHTAYLNEKRMLQTGGKHTAGFGRYDYALRNYDGIYTGGSKEIGYQRNTDKETLSLIERILNEGNNGKNLWTHAWICMHHSDNEIVNSQANMTKANQYSMWHDFFNTTGYELFSNRQSKLLD